LLVQVNYSHHFIPTGCKHKPRLQRNFGN
jgi:hypothetical protein